MVGLLGAMRPTAPRRGPLWASLLLLLLVAVVVGALGLVVRGGSAAAPVVAIGSGPDAAGGVAAPTVPTAGGLTAGGIALLPVATVGGPDGDLSAFAGRPVRAAAVVVLSVPADEGFWVGTGGDDRVWVQILGAGESPYRVRPGERVDLAGQVVAHGPEFAAAVGVVATEGADQLTRQAAHLEVPQGEVRRAG